MAHVEDCLKWITAQENCFRIRSEDFTILQWHVRGLEIQLDRSFRYSAWTSGNQSGHYNEPNWIGATGTSTTVSWTADILLQRRRAVIGMQENRPSCTVATARLQINTNRRTDPAYMEQQVAWLAPARRLNPGKTDAIRLCVGVASRRVVGRHLKGCGTWATHGLSSFAHICIIYDSLYNFWHDFLFDDNCIKHWVSYKTKAYAIATTSSW